MKYWHLGLYAIFCALVAGGACTLQTTNTSTADDGVDTGAQTSAGGGPANGNGTTSSAGGSGSDTSAGGSTGGSVGSDAGEAGADSGGLPQSGAGAGSGGSSSGSGGVGVTSPDPPGQLAPSEFLAPTCDSEQTLPDVTGDLTLPANSCYRVDGRVTVSAGSLSIEPGVTLKFATDASLSVTNEAAIVALGTSEAPVTFTGTITEPGHWRSLDILSNNPENRLEHVQFAYGGSTATCCDSGREAAMLLVADNGRATLKNSVFAFSGGHGLEVEVDGALDAFEGNLFVGNGDAPVRIAANLAGRLDKGSNYLGDPATPNGEAFIELRGSQIADDATWAWTNLPFRAPSGLAVAGATLTLTPGVDIEFDPGTQLSIGEAAALNAVGSAAAPISLRGSVNDRGGWIGVLVLSNTVVNRLAFVELENAGERAVCCNSARAPAGLLVDPGASIAIENSSFVQSAGYGLHAMPGSKMQPFANNHFGGNGEAALLLSASSIAQLDQASTYGGGNDNERVDVRGDTVSGPGTWPGLDVPYLVLGNTTIDSDIEIAPGAHLTFAADVGLWVALEGSLRASSAAGDIVFDGRVDQAGYWTGIGFESASELNLLDGVTIDGAGSRSFCCASARAPAAVLIDPSSQVVVENSTLSRSAGWGIFARPGALPITQAGNTFVDNVLGDVSLP